MEVPDAPHRSRPRNRPSALTIHVLCGETGRYAEAAASRALPGWTAAEIHLALNEPQRSAETWQALERVGRALGEREGNAPGDDPIMGRLLADARQEGIATTVRDILAQRGIAHSRALFASDRLSAHATERLVAAALACRSEADFLARLRATAGHTPPDAKA